MNKRTAIIAIVATWIVAVNSMASTIVFEDTFNNLTYSGTAVTNTRDWIVTGVPYWNMNDGVGNSGAFFLRNSTASMRKDINLTSAVTNGRAFTLSFDAWYESATTNTQAGYVSITRDSGTTWTTNFTLLDSSSSNVDYDLPGYTGSYTINIDASGWTAGQLAGFGFKFSQKATLNTDHFNVDNVQLSVIPAAPVAPVAVNDSYNITQNRTFTNAAPGVLTNDTDVNGDSLTAILISSTTHGTLSFSTNGSFIYTPNTNFTGTDTFTYEAYDGGLYSSPATVTLTVSPVHAPVANSDVYYVAPGTVYTNAAPGVLANDTDADGDRLTAVLISSTTHGTLSFSTNGSFIYTPNPGFTGMDTFTYEAYDGGLYSSPATVYLTMVASQTLTFNDWANEGVADRNSTKEIATISTNGATFTLSISSAPGNVRAPAANKLGVQDGLNNLQIDQGSAGTNTVDDESLEFTISVAGKTLSLFDLAGITLGDFVANYTVEFQDRTTNYITTGPKTSFNYTGSSGATVLTGLTALTPLNTGVWKLKVIARAGTVGVTNNGITVNSMSFDYVINTAPQAPVANNDTFLVEPDTVFTKEAPGVLVNDTDYNGDALAASLVSSTTHGTLSFSTNGSFIYTPNPSFIGTDTFTYAACKASDGAFQSAAATVTLTVKHTEPKAHFIFQSNMVLQRDRPIPVWGNGAAGKTVTVSLSSGQTATTVVDALGKWEVSLAAMAATTNPLTMTISDSYGSTTRTNLLVGDVFFCSGQSNAGFSLGSTEGGDTEAASANHPLLRHIKMPRIQMSSPQDDIVVEASIDYDPVLGVLKSDVGAWTQCSPATAGDYSATYYYFGRDLTADLGIPVGIIQSCYAGTAMETWSRSVLPNAHPDSAELSPAHALYNGMVSPLLKMPIKGFGWYQGERNHNDGFGYTEKLRIMVNDWRTGWGLGNIPFIYLQIPPVFEWVLPEDAQPALPYFWEAQTLAMDVITNSYMVTISDITTGALHTRRKAEGGERMTLRALKNIYGVTNVLDSGPVFTGFTVEGSALRLNFTNTGSGLAIITNIIGYDANNDYIIDGYGTNRDGFFITGEDLNNNGIMDPGEDIDGDGVLDLSEWNIEFPYLNWFEICDAQGNFAFANATIDGHTVVVSSPSIPNPVGVRYAWDRHAKGNLMNKEGLPARLFRMNAPFPGGTNTAPVITGGATTEVVMSEDSSPTPFNLTLYATDAEGDTITWSVSTPAAHGTATASGTGVGKAIGYTPAANYNGADSFVVQVSDGNGGTNTITVNVTIQSVNDAPSVSLTAPTNGASYTAPASIALTATASDVDGTIASVSFYNSTNLLGTDTTSPYAYTWTNVSTGSYSLTARATDNSGAVSTSAVVAVTVVNTTYTLTTVTGANGTVSPASTNVLEGNSANFVITASNYYRIASLTTNETAVTGMTFDNNSTTTNFTWSNVQASGVLAATFTAQVTTNVPAQVPYSWLAQYGLTNYNTDATNDVDLDGLTAWQEYIAGTIPNNATSVLKAAQNTRNVITWTPVTGRIYSVYWSTNLVKGFQALETNIPYPRSSYTNATPDSRVNHYQIKVRLQ